MLPKKKRVNKKDFEFIIKNGKTLYSSLFSFYYIYSSLPHYAFVAPKKIFKGAIKRNKYRRIGYNLLREMKYRQDVSGVFMYKKEALLATKEEINQNIKFLINKIPQNEQNSN
jgi:ribonuclease P protein component